MLDILFLFGILGTGFLILLLFGYLRELLHKKFPSFNVHAVFTLMFFGMSALALYSIILFYIYTQEQF